VFEIFGPAYTYVDGQLSSFLGTGLGNVINAVRGPLLLALTLYIVLYGYAIFRGSISEPVMDGVVRLVKLCFIFTVATTVAYNDYVTQPLFTDLPNWLAGAISGGSVTSVGSSFDKFLARGFDLATTITDTATIVDPSPYITAAIVIIATVIVTGLGFGIVMIAKVALALLVALGPIFIACLVFEASRQFFFGWLKQGVNYLLLFALIITIFELILALVEGQWGSINGQADPEMGGILFTALCILGGIFFLQTPNIAAGIAGGAAAGVGDFANAARGALGGQPAQPASAAGGRSPRGTGGGSVSPTRQTSASRNGHPRR
jgi:type IV secretion system protein VirB6